MMMVMVAVAVVVVVVKGFLRCKVAKEKAPSFDIGLGLGGGFGVCEFGVFLVHVQ